MSSSGAPSARYGHAAYFNGQNMVIWGGTGEAASSCGTCKDSYSFSAQTGNWQNLNPSPDAYTRINFSAIFSKGVLLIFGGMSPASSARPRSIQNLNDESKTWTQLPISMPSSKIYAASAATNLGGIIIWGGLGSLGDLESVNLTNTGYIFSQF